MAHSNEELFRMVCELDESKNVERIMFLNPMRKENDAEHSFMCALAAMALDELIPPEIDRFKLIQLCLVHDLVEIRVGDTWYRAPKELKSSQHDRETAAAKEMFENFPLFLDLWLEYEDRKTPEAIYAKMMDQIQSMCTVVKNRGLTWRLTGSDPDFDYAYNKWIVDSGTKLGEFMQYLFDYAEKESIFNRNNDAEV